MYTRRKIRKKEMIIMRTCLKWNKANFIRICLPGRSIIFLPGKEGSGQGNN